MINELSEFIPNVHFELVPIKDLVSNQEYQRNLSWCHVKKAVENFDLNQVNPIKVSRRNGIEYSGAFSIACPAVGNRQSG